MPNTIKESLSIIEGYKDLIQSYKTMHKTQEVIIEMLQAEIRTLKDDLDTRYVPPGDHLNDATNYGLARIEGKSHKALKGGRK